MDDNARAVAEAMIALAREEMDFSRVRAVRVRLDVLAGGGMELAVAATLAADAGAEGAEGTATFTAAAPEGAA